MARSLIRQLEQIRRSETYDDVVGGFNTSTVAEPTVSGSLQEDLNVLRSMLVQLKGNTNWYDDPGKYFDPSDTDNSDTSNKQMSLSSIKGKTMDSKTILIAVEGNNEDNYYTVSGTSTGVLSVSGTITTRYATHEDRRGLPIWQSTTGVYHDESGTENTCRCDVLDAVADGEFTDGTHVIYAKMYDGLDHGGYGSGTDIYFKFYKNGAECDLSGTGVTQVKFVYPHRRVISDMAEHEWLRTEFVSSWGGDIELIEDISNLWNYTGAADDETAPTWTNTTSSYLLDGIPTDLEAAINDINDGVGNRLYTEDNYITDGEALTTSLDALDQQVKDNTDAIASSSGEKYIESVVSDINKNTDHDIPVGAYTPCSDVGREGKNMDVCVNGQLLAADTGAAGVNADRDYAEIDTDTIRFRFKVHTGANITYTVRQ